MRRCAARAILFCLFAGGLILSCERDQTPVGRGGRIFQRTCSTCHGPDGRGRLTLGLIKPPRDLTQAEFHAQFSDLQLREVIRYGKGQMPAFGGLMADEDIGYVIAYVRTLGPNPTPPAGASPGPSGEPPKNDAPAVPAHDEAAGATGVMAMPSEDTRGAGAR